MNDHISVEAVRDLVLDLPEMASWPEVAGLFAPRGEELRMDWQLPALACRALAAASSVALPAVAAIACLQISIILVDDMLDQDPRGAYHRLGAGRTANLALALQAACFAVVNQADVPLERRSAACAALAQAALTTAFGQDLDVQNLHGEANYWRVVRNKSTPFYGVAIQSGALLAGAHPDVADRLYRVGALFGELIQIFDDLVDAFQEPANPDWLEGRNNLAILYATSADYPQRTLFHDLLARAADVAVLRQAQQLLVSSGAMSYCVYLLMQHYREAHDLVRQAPLPDPQPLLKLLDQQMVPVVDWLQGFGVALGPEVTRIAAS